MYEDGQRGPGAIMRVDDVGDVPRRVALSVHDGDFELRADLDDVALGDFLRNVRDIVSLAAVDDQVA